MVQQAIDSEVYNSVCEAVGCFAEVETEIAISVGTKGTISLRLCKECVNRFKDKRGPDA